MKHTAKNMNEFRRQARHERIRKVVYGTKERPRLCVHRSLKNFYVQLIDDVDGRVIFGLSSRSKAFSGKAPSGGNIAGAKALGELFAKEAKQKGVSRVSFDRGGYLYHGRVKAFAEAAREGGLEF